MGEIKPQHALGFMVENMKRVKLVEVQLEPKGGVTFLAGANESGKSSTMDAICEMLAGGKKQGAWQMVTPKRTGADRGVTELQLDDYIIRRVVTDKTDTVTVKARDTGASFSSPQKLLDGMISVIALDPAAFCELNASQQAEQLLSACPVQLDLKKNAEQIKLVYNARRDANRDASQAQIVLDGMPTVDQDAPATEVSVSALAGKLTSLRGVDAALQHEQNRRGELAREVARRTQARLKAQADESIALKALAEADTGLEGRVLHVDEIASLESEIEHAEDVNQKVRARTARCEYEKSVKQLRLCAQGKESELLELEKERADALKTAAFPLPGLTIGADGGLLYEGLSLHDGSKARRYLIGLAIGIAQRPRIRMAFIRDASIFDAKNLALLREIAEKHDIRLILEVLDSKDPAAIVLEDGVVKAGE